METRMSGRRPNQVIFQRLAEIAQALDHPNRLELLESLAQGQQFVEELTEQSGMSFANTSRHLKILRRARLVETHTDGSGGGGRPAARRHRPPAALGSPSCRSPSRWQRWRRHRPRAPV